MVARGLLEMGRIDVLVNNAFSPYAFDPKTAPDFGSSHGTRSKRSLTAPYARLTTCARRFCLTSGSAARAASST